MQVGTDLDPAIWRPAELTTPDSPGPPDGSRTHSGQREADSQGIEETPGRLVIVRPRGEAPDQATAAWSPPGETPYRGRHSSYRYAGRHRPVDAGADGWASRFVVILKPWLTSATWTGWSRTRGAHV